MSIAALIFAAESPPKGPDFCATKLLSGVFTDHNNQIRLIKDDWIWTYNQTLKRVSNAVQRNLNEAFIVQSLAHISSVADCRDERSNYKCAELNAFRSLVIIVYKRPNSHFAGDYEVKKVIEGSVTRLDPKIELPFGLKTKGNVFSPNEVFWPKELSEGADKVEDKGVVVVYNPIHFNLILLANGRPKARICGLAMDSDQKWASVSGGSLPSGPKWKCHLTSNEWRFIGGFVKNSNTYVVAVNDRNNRLFTVNRALELIDIDIDIQNYFGCGLKINTFMSEESEYSDNQSNNSSVVPFVVVAVVILILLIAVIAFIAFFAIRKTSEDKESSESENKRDKREKKDKRDKRVVPKVGKMVDPKGNEVDETQIGSLDSKVDWDIVLATPSTVSTEDQPIDDSEAKQKAITKRPKK